MSTANIRREGTPFHQESAALTKRHSPDKLAEEVEQDAEGRVTDKYRISQ